ARHDAHVDGLPAHRADPGRLARSAPAARGCRERRHQLGMGPAVVPRRHDRGGQVPHEGHGVHVGAGMTTQALTLEEKKAAARARAQAAREAEQAGVANVTITGAAAAYIRETAAEQGAQEGVRLRILAGGCSGLEYRLDLLAAGEGPQPGERDVTSNGIRLL